MQKIFILLTLAISNYCFGQVSLDRDFGQDGILLTNVAPMNLLDESKAIGGYQQDGKLIIAAQVTGRNPYVKRFNLNGSQDETFHKISLSGFHLTDMLIQGDDKILLAGSYYSTSDTYFHFALARLNSDGSLDTDFGDNGKTHHSLGLVNGQIYAIALQPDGKIIAAGYRGSTVDPTTNQAGLSVFELARYLPDGNLDNSFGAAGSVTINLPGNRSEAYDVIVQPDGKIVAVGLDGDNGSSPTTSFAIVRLNADGSPDNTFDADGMKTIMMGRPGKSVANSVVMLPGGNYILGGVSLNSGSSDRDFALVGLLSNGDLDPAFNGGDVLRVDFSGGNDQVNALALQNDGMILAGGSAAGNFGIARLDANGNLDLNFDTDGTLTKDVRVGNNDFITSISIQPDNKILSVGYSSNGSGTDVSVVRFLANGSMDNSFDTDGQLEYSPGYSTDDARAMVVQPDGKILVTGQYRNTNTTSSAIVRYLPEGEPDPSFGTGGKMLFPGGGDWELVESIALQSDGKILIGGNVDSEITIWRFNADGTPDLGFGVGGKVVVPAGSGTVRAISVQSDGTILIAGNTSLAAQNVAFLVAKYSQTGVLDNSFGTAGLAIMKFDESQLRSYAHAVAVQSDGKIIIGGRTHPSLISGTEQFALARLNTNGTLDLSFDGDGIINLGAGGLTGLIILEDYKIVATGYGNDAFMAARFNADGTPDSDFGTAGITTIDFGYPTSEAFASHLQVDGKILLAGFTGSTGSEDFAIARLNEDGTPDLSFDDDGKVTLSFLETFDHGDIEEGATGISTFENRIVVAGYAIDDFALLMFDNNIALPLELISFSVSPSGTDNLLRWTTDHEEGTRSFEIERSYDGQNFTRIASIASANSPGLQQYSFLDKDAWISGGNRRYYRLRQVDIDDRFTYSQIVSVETQDEVFVKLFPNPVNETTVLQVWAERIENLNWQIFDIRGRKLQRGNVMIFNGANNITIPAKSLTPGVYILQLQGSQLKKSLRFVVQ